LRQFLNAAIVKGKVYKAMVSSDGIREMMEGGMTQILTPDYRTAVFDIVKTYTPKSALSSISRFPSLTIGSL